ncbi:hypothetical protein BMS3Abin02_01876 [bacterium BMS3Abin02]|nr:hypothetical protein BMS3Abin02_01876 [bacterium BMS3Abin02]
MSDTGSDVHDGSSTLVEVQIGAEDRPDQGERLEIDRHRLHPDTGEDLEHIVGHLTLRGDHENGEHRLTVGRGELLQWNEVEDRLFDRNRNVLRGTEGQ